MKTQPRISAAFLERWLKKHYQMTVQRVRFMPRGECSWGFVLDSPDGARYYLKLWQLGLCGQTLTEARIQTMMTLYYEFGIQQMTPPPVRSLSSGSYINRLSRYQSVLLPWVEGYPATDQTLNEFQERQLGALLASLHLVKLATRELPQAEDFAPHYPDQVRQLLAEATQSQATAIQNQMATLINDNKQSIEPWLEEFEQLQAQMTQKDTADFVVCHGDPSAGNIVVTPDGQVVLIDWDTLCHAPPERDLFYLHAQNGALDGYQRLIGDYTLDEEAMRYYRLHWTLQEILEYGERTLYTEQSAAQSDHDVAALAYELGQANLL